MPKFPSYKPREIEKILKKNNFILKRQSGSHKVYYNQNTDKTAIVPFHSRELPQGTIKSIIKQSDVSEEVFLKK